MYILYREGRLLIDHMIAICMAMPGAMGASLYIVGFIKNGSDNRGWITEDAL